ncbi:hypothetical protein F543_11870 [Bibersteinia trehalosi USDA-ARS-USMARC-189]|uniref:Uncharacterized protein n=1 Tax=Bibersteinia trehalosi USDA-ARS-USMARC-189 TaxID=1263831 RepID=A0ABM5PCI8_BIBTR|nr:hypothetical protein WQG_11580 [Bibersteinia trehalosi USDA-ARS-USMARC-192]AHG84051.1 hypothetical protein F543_11870 [Bibersteinia trehalosi USDA-ARS-USMARC-189]
MKLQREQAVAFVEFFANCFGVVAHANSSLITTCLRTRT